MPGGPVGTGKTHNDLKYTWFASRASMPSSGFPYPIGDLQCAYWSRGSLVSTQRTLNQMEDEWLGLMSGKSTTDGDADAWEIMVSRYTPGPLAASKIMEENQITFYSSASLMP